MDTLQTAKAYTKCLIDLMSFIDGVHYDSSSSFSCDQLALIMADQVATYLNKKVYDKEERNFLLWKFVHFNKFLMIRRKHSAKVVIDVYFCIKFFQCRSNIHKNRESILF